MPIGDWASMPPSISWSTIHQGICASSEASTSQLTPSSGPNIGQTRA